MKGNRRLVIPTRSALIDKNENGRIKTTKRNFSSKIAARSYHENFGKLLAHYDVLETKYAQFGNIFARDRNTDISKLPMSEGYKKINRRDMCRKALELYNQNEIVRPAINILSAAIFSNHSPDIRGKNKELVETAQKIITSNGINFHNLAREGELFGDVFLWFDPNGDQTEIRSLDASMTEVELENNNIRKVKGYKLGINKPLELSTEIVEHLKFNTITTTQYGNSSIRQLLYWIDALDTLIEKNWMRGAQYYGNPLLAIIGVPGPYQATVKAQIESELQRAGKSWVLPPDTEVKTPSLALDYPIADIVGWIFRIISITLEIPITLLGTADAESRGNAFFAHPRFELAIKPKREVWRIGLRNFFIKIFKAAGLLDDTKVLSTKDFDIGFLPIFARDLTDIADVIEIYRDRKLVSKQSAREMVGLDHSDEEERMEDEPEETLSVIDPRDPNAPPGAQTQNPDNVKNKREARRQKQAKRREDGNG